MACQGTGRGCVGTSGASDDRGQRFSRLAAPRSVPSATAANMHFECAQGGKGSRGALAEKLLPAELLGRCVNTVQPKAQHNAHIRNTHAAETSIRSEKKKKYISQDTWERTWWRRQASCMPNARLHKRQTNWRSACTVPQCCRNCPMRGKGFPLTPRGHSGSGQKNSRLFSWVASLQSCSIPAASTTKAACVRADGTQARWTLLMCSRRAPELENVRSQRSQGTRPTIASEDISRPNWTTRFAYSVNRFCSHAWLAIDPTLLIHRVISIKTFV
jgi:hypothetical protein